MTVHMIETRRRETDYVTTCPCTWSRTWPIFGGQDDVTSSMVVEQAEREHLVKSDAAVVEAVRIAGAFLTRRRHSFVGRLDDNRIAIIVSTADGHWQAYLNDRTQIGTEQRNVADAVHGVEQATGHIFK